MKLLATVLLATLSVAACGGPDDSGMAGTGGDSDANVTFCSCVNEPATTDSKAAACGAMLNALTPEEAARKTNACRQQVPIPAGGPDLCFCLKSSSTDPDVVKACQAILDKENMTPREISNKVVACMQ